MAYIYTVYIYIPFWYMTVYIYIPFWYMTMTNSHRFRLLHDDISPAVERSSTIFGSTDIGAMRANGSWEGVNSAMARDDHYRRPTVQRVCAGDVYKHDRCTSCVQWTRCATSYRCRLRVSELINKYD